MKEVIASIKTVFKKPVYVLIAGVASFILVAISAFLPQRELLAFVFKYDSFKWSSRFKILKDLLFNVSITMKTPGKIIFVLLVILTGISIALLAYYLKRRLHFGLESGASIGGIILSVMGVGCASCGSVILSSIFGFSATIAFIGFLPLGGIELGLIGLGLLVWSIYSISQKIQKQIVCKFPYES